MHERPSSFHKKSKLASVTFYNKFASAPPTKPASNTPACPILAGADVSTPEVELLESSVAFTPWQPSDVPQPEDKFLFSAMTFARPASIGAGAGDAKVA